MEQLIVKYSVSDAAIAELKEKHSGLTVAKDGTKAVHEARMIVKEKRVEVEKTRKELKADSLEYGRKVDSEAKRLTELLEAIEKPLEAEENAEKERLAAIKAEEERKESEQLNSRIAMLNKVHASHDVNDLKLMRNIQFESLYNELFMAHKKEQEAIKAESERIAAEKMAEEKRMAEEREELKKAKEEQQAREAAFKLQQEKEQAEVRKAHEAVAKEQQAREKAIAEKERLIREEELKKEAAEKAIKAESERKEKEIANEKRQAELAPDKDKFLAYIESLLAVKCTPPVHSDAKGILISFERLLKQACDGLAKEVNNL